MGKKIKQIIKKLFLLLLACLMVTVISPPVLFYNASSPKDYGEFLRFSPQSEEYSKDLEEYADLSEGEKSAISFDISHFEKVEANDIVSAKIRFAFLKGSGSVDNKIFVNLGAIKNYAFLTPYTKADANALCEIDVTEYVKNLIKNNMYTLKIELFSKNSIGALMGKNNHTDPSMRPSLKVATGQWVDIDDNSLKRAEISEMVYISKDIPDMTADTLTKDMVHIGNSDIVYIGAKLNQSAYLAEISSAILSLEKLTPAPCDVEVHFLNNNEWTAESLSAENLPSGPEMTVKNVSLEKSGRINIDITQGINEARKKGIDEITIYICSKNGSPATFSRNAKIYIEETDDKNLICALNAGIYALGNNLNNKVVNSLRRIYTDESGEKAYISWEQDENQEVLRVNERGEITRPLWFEPDAKVNVRANISSGDKKITRDFEITVKREDIPSYKGYTFSNYIDIGSSNSEREAMLDSVRVSSSRGRFFDGGYHEYRELYKNGVMLLNFSCDSEKTNYITFKLWKNDEADYLEIADCNTDEKITIKTPELEEENGFIYATYKLPLSFTKGKEGVSLRLYSKNGSRRIYAAYLTNSPWFNPADFKTHGEKVVQNAFSEPLVQSTYIDRGNKIITFLAKDEKMVFEMGDYAKISQTLENYSRFCDNCPIIRENQVQAVNYGDYKLIWNEGDTDGYIPYEELEMSGVYRDVENDRYYTFFKQWQSLDEGVISKEAEVYDGKSHLLPKRDVMLLLRVAMPLNNSLWQVSLINGKALDKMGFKDSDSLDSVTVNLLGEVDAKEATFVACVYENDKLIAMHKKEFDLLKNQYSYRLNLSKDKISVSKGQSVRIFVIEKGQSLIDVQPIIEIL